MDLLAKWCADGRPLGLPTQGQARVLSSQVWARLNNGTFDFSSQTDSWSTRIPIPLLAHVFIPIHHPGHWCLCHINIGSKSMMYMDPSGPVTSVREAVVRMKTWRWMHSRHSAQNWSNLGVDVPRWELRLCEAHNTLLDQLPDITRGMAKILKANKDVRTTTQLTQAGIAQEAIDQWQRCGIFLLGTEDESLGGWNWSARPPIDTPYQSNAYDCGMFVLLYIIYCTRGWTMNFTQEHMEHCRSWFLRTLISVGSWEESFTCRSCLGTFFSEASQPQICASCHQGPVGGKRVCPSKQRRAATDQCTPLRALSVSRGRAMPSRGKKAKLTTQVEVTVGRGNSEVLPDVSRGVGKL